MPGLGTGGDKIKKLSWDNEGASIWTFLIIFVAMLIVWQYVGDSSGIVTPLSFINETEPEDVYMDYNVFYINNLSSPAYFSSVLAWETEAGKDFDMPHYFEVWYFQDNSIVENIQFDITTNAPAVLLGNQWHIKLEAHQRLIGPDKYHTLIDSDITTGSGDKTFSYHVDEGEIQVAGLFAEWTQYDLTLTDPSGNVHTVYNFILV